MCGWAYFIFSSDGLSDRPRIDFDIVNVMEPMTIAGAVLGSLINKLLPG